MGNLCAVKACEEFKVASQNDTVQLNLAKEKSYKKGFYDGVSLLLNTTQSYLMCSLGYACRRLQGRESEPS